MFGFLFRGKEQKIENRDGGKKGYKTNAMIGKNIPLDSESQTSNRKLQVCLLTRFMRSTPSFIPNIKFYCQTKEAGFM